jgi:hypothetical protein
VHNNPVRATLQSTVSQRRGMLAVLAAAIATVVARSAKSVEAATGGNFILGVNNQAQNMTRLDTFGDQGLVVGSDTSAGVSGSCSAVSGFGVIGLASSGYGITGVTHAASHAGLLGFADTAGSAALQGSSTAPNATAGAFFGPVALNGDVTISAFQGGAGSFAGKLTVAGALVVSGTKSAAVRASDGATHLVYCLESPESWFEDFGEAKLENGSVQVDIDPLFAEVAQMSNYHVFLTSYGDTEGLHVTNRTVTSFVVRENHNGKSQATFSYRVVARRKDVPQARLPKVDLPATTFTPAFVDHLPIPTRPGPAR